MHYEDNLFEYEQNKENSWLCKKIGGVLSNSDLLDQIWLVFPPSDIVSYLNLKLDLNKMCWYDDKGEPVIYCNNNKASYYYDPAVGITFIRSDTYEKIKAKWKINFFVFTERRIGDKGFSKEVDYHHEIIDGEFLKEIPNEGTVTSYQENFRHCENCKYGFYKSYDETKSLADIVIKFSYSNDEES